MSFTKFSGRIFISLCSAHPRHGVALLMRLRTRYEGLKVEECLVLTRFRGVKGLGSSSIVLFKLYWTLILQRGMQSLPIVKDFQPVTVHRPADHHARKYIQDDG